jgi:hypothetical protein
LFASSFGFCATHLLLRFASSSFDNLCVRHNSVGHNGVSHNGVRAGCRWRTRGGHRLAAPLVS